MRKIPDNNLAYPIFIQYDTGSTGSGFFLHSKTVSYLVTAKHVLFDDKGVLRGKELTLTCQTQDINDHTVTKYKINLDLALISKHETADVVVEIGKLSSNNTGGYSLQHGHGITMIEKGKTETVGVSINEVTLLKDVLVSNDVVLYGYPSSLGIKETPQFDYTRPLLRKGIVANTYPEKGTIILDCPVYYGNSGGPVVEIDQTSLTESSHKVIGVVSQFVPFVEQWVNTQNKLVNTSFLNSGYSIVVSMDKVLELINKN